MFPELLKVRLSIYKKKDDPDDPKNHRPKKLEHYIMFWKTFLYKEINAFLQSVALNMGFERLIQPLTISHTVQNHLEKLLTTTNTLPSRY